MSAEDDEWRLRVNREQKVNELCVWRARTRERFWNGRRAHARARIARDCPSNARRVDAH